MNFFDGRVWIMFVFIFFIIFNIKFCLNLVLMNVDYNWNIDVKNFIKGKISIN